VTTDEAARAIARPRFDLSRLVGIQPPWLFALIVGLALLVVFAELPGRPLILHTLQKLAHPSVFGVIAVSALILLRQRTNPARAPWIDYLLALAIAILIGGVTEVGQMFTHRDPALKDVGLDARGACCALALAAAFDIRCRRGRFARSLRAAYALVALALAAVILTPLAWSVAGYANRSQRFPVLFIPDNRLDVFFVSLPGAPVERVQLPAAFAHRPGEMTLRVPMTARTYPGVSLDEPSPDWRGYQTLVVDVTNPSRLDLELVIRVHDRLHAGGFDDRFNADIRIPARQRQTFEFPLSAIESAPRGRRMDLAHIAGVMLFHVGPGGTREFWLDRIELR
jgi:VanZ family protein